MKSKITLIDPDAMKTLSISIHLRVIVNVQKDRIGVLENKLI